MNTFGWSIYTGKGFISELFVSKNPIYENSIFVAFKIDDDLFNYQMVDEEDFPKGYRPSDYDNV